MDFLTKFLQLKPAKSGSATPSSKPPSASPEKEHETNVQFAREFVEELVEKLPGDSVPVLPGKEDTTRYSIAFSDISAFSETSLPDLLQPEAQYKKQADTDTDTTDYESAVESDALSLNASLGLDRSDPVSSPDVLDAAHSPLTDLTPQVLQFDAEAFEDAEASFSEGQTPPYLDISALCLDVGKLCLETPQRPTKDSSGGDSFLITLNSDCQVSSTDTSFNTTECDLPVFVLGESFVDKSLLETSVEAGLLSTTFDVGSTGEVATEYNLEIIRTLDFDLEKPAASGTEAEVTPPAAKTVLCEGTQLSCEADVAAIQSGGTESVDPQATENQEAFESEPQIVPAEETVETGHVEKPVVETEPLNASTVDASLEEPANEELQKSLVVSEVSTSPLGKELSTREVDSGVCSESVSVVEDTTTEVLPSPETELSYQEVDSVVTASEGSVNESVPVEDTTTEVLSAPETELPCKEEDSAVTASDVVSNEASSVVEDTSTKVLPAPETELSSAAVILSDPAGTASTEAVPSAELELSVEPEASLIVDHQLSTCIVGPEKSICIEEPAKSEPDLQSSFSPDREFVDALSTVEQQVATSFVETSESEPIANSSLIQDNESKKVEDLPIVGITVKEPIVEPTIKSEKVDGLPITEPQALIVENTKSTPIVVSIAVLNAEPATLANLQVTEPQASVSVALDQRALSPSPISFDDPELIAVSSGPVGFSPCHSPEQSGRKRTISPSFLLIGNNTGNQQVSPVPAVSVVTPVPTYRRPSVGSKEAADLIDPVGAVWSPDAESESCFSTPPPQRKSLPRFPKQGLISPITNPIQFRASPLVPGIVNRNEAFPFVSSSRLDSLVPSGDPFSPVPIKTEPALQHKNLEGDDSCHIATKTLKSSKAIEDPSLNDLREICQRQQRELDNQQFSSGFFGETPYNSLAIASIAAEAAKVSEDIHNASIEQIESEMDENVNPVPLDKKWLSERSGAEAKDDARETSKSRNILGGGDGFADSLDKQNKNIMTASIDAQTNQSEAGPEIALQDDEETFADSEGFDFLSAKASTGPSDRLVRESLYTKFDPLATPQATHAPAPAAAPAARHAPLPMPPKFSENDKISPPSGQLIHLAPTPSPSTPPRTATPPRSATPCANDGLTETPPRNSAARALVDRLISLSPAGRNVQASPVKPPPPVVKSPLPPTMEQMSEELVLLRELLSEEEMAYKVSLESLQEKLKHSELELMSMRLKAKSAEEREQKLKARLGEKVAAQKQLAAVMCEYEKTISKLVGEKDLERTSFIKEREAIIKEKDVALGHLTNIEIAFSDVHQKYERCKTVVEAFKSNEDVLRESLAKYEATIHKQEQKYEMLKAHAMTQLENANQELDAVRRNQATESAKLKAMLKKSELKTSSLEEMLEQKIKENCELASICDDLIAKVGT